MRKLYVSAFISFVFSFGLFPLLVQARPDSDANAFTVAITSPASGATVQSSVSITANVTADNTVTKVEFFVDNFLKGTVTATPYSYVWDTRTHSNGSHTIKVKATDAVNQTAEATATVTISNYSLTITAPLAGATVNGVVNISANVTTSDHISKVSFLVDEVKKEESTQKANTYSFNWDSTTGTNASHTLKIVVDYDDTHASSSATVTVTVANPTEFTLTITSGVGGTTSPAPGSYKYNTGNDATVTASANVGYTFDKWTGSAVPTGKDKDNPIVFRMNANKILTANFFIFKVDLGGAIVVFVDQNNKLRKVNASGIVSNVINTDPDVKLAQFDPNGNLYIVFNEKQPVPASGEFEVGGAALTSFIMIKVNPKTNAVVGVDSQLANLVWNPDSVSRNIQFDGSGKIYYLAQKTDGKIVLRRYTSEANITELINENIKVGHWLVRTDGTVVIAGETLSTKTKWLRKMAPGGALSYIATPADVGWVLEFPDGRVYAGLPESLPFQGVYKLPTDLGYMDDTAAGAPYIGFTKTGFTPTYDVTTLATGVNATYAKGFTDTAGVYLLGYGKTAGNDVIGLTGTGQYRTVLYYYPTPKLIKLSLVDRITLLKETLGELLIPGTKAGVNKLILYNLTSKIETNILYENIEIYHLDVLSNGSILFDGLDFTKGTYVVGMFERAAGGGLKGGDVRTLYGYKELCSLSGKPTDFFVLEGGTENPQAYIKASPTMLGFGALTSGIKTAPQKIRISNIGQGTMNWSVTPSQPWLSCSPTSGTQSGVVNVSVDPTGLAAGDYVGTITVESAEAANSPQNVTVGFSVKSTVTGGSQPPFGEFSTPIHGTTGITGAIPVTGWVLDDIETTKVEIWRDPAAGEASANALVYIGEAIFVEGARSDIEQIYPSYPMCSKAGWGYMLLTNFLPAQGNGTYKLHAFAYDREGNSVLLGSKTITCGNATAIKPFGTIDTPTQGGDASGDAFVNFGWVLTPRPNMIPFDGSTIDVFVDGAYWGHPTYNQYRIDVATNFPGLLNTPGPVGFFYLNTLGYANGVHTIHWIATDDGRRADGIGSRYFTVTNVGAAPVAGAEIMKGEDLGLEGPITLDRLMELPISFEPLEVRTGFDLQAAPEAVTPDRFGTIRIVISEVGRVEIDLKSVLGLGRVDARKLTFAGHQVVGKELRKLPIGSNLDEKKGIFTWSPGPGFLGQYHLLFVVKNEAGVVKRIPVTVVIKPKR